VMIPRAGRQQREDSTTTVTAAAWSSQHQAEMEDQDAVIENELTWKFSSCPPVEQISKP